MKKTWHYLINQFANTTVTNFKKALKLSNYHDALLKKAMTENPGDPDWAFLYNRYNPLHLTYANAYTKWKKAGGTQEGQTLNLDQLLLLLITKINKWDVQVQNVFEIPRLQKDFSRWMLPLAKGQLHAHHSGGRRNPRSYRAGSHQNRCGWFTPCSMMPAMCRKHPGEPKQPAGS